MSDPNPLIPPADKSTVMMFSNTAISAIAPIEVNYDCTIKLITDVKKEDEDSMLLCCLELCCSADEKIINLPNCNKQSLIANLEAKVLRSLHDREISRFEVKINEATYYNAGKLIQYMTTHLGYSLPPDLAQPSQHRQSSITSNSIQHLHPS